MIKANKKTYKSHVAIDLEVDGKKMGWIQFERDGFAFYKPTPEPAEVRNLGSMVVVKFP